MIAHCVDGARIARVAHISATPQYPGSPSLARSPVSVAATGAASPLPQRRPGKATRTYTGAALARRKAWGAQYGPLVGGLIRDAIKKGSL